MNLPHWWFSAGSSAELWGAAGTYKRIPYDALPSLGQLDGSFAWLPSSPVEDGMKFRDGKDDALLANHMAEAERLGLTIPASFLKFMSDATLPLRIPSCTSCYYDLQSRFVPIPNHDGPERLLRFMNDQQSCYFWHLLLKPDGSHQIAIAWPEWIENESAKTLEDISILRDVSICASSFEEFIKRFWIENTIWFQHGKKLDGELLAYSEAAQRVDL